MTLIVFVLVFIGVMFIGYQTINFNMYPDVDIDTVQLKVEMPVGTRFEDTVAAVARMEGNYQPGRSSRHRFLWHNTGAQSRLGDDRHTA
jgi:multidrug efflux pump subunit AcrB